MYVICCVLIKTHLLKKKSKIEKENHFAQKIKKNIKILIEKRNHTHISINIYLCYQLF